MKRSFIFIILVLLCFMVVYDLFFLKRNHFTWPYELASAIWAYSIGFSGGVCFSFCLEILKGNITYEDSKTVLAMTIAWMLNGVIYVIALP